MAISGPKGVFLITIFKVAILIHGAIILGVGLHSTGQSSWVHQNVQFFPLNISEGKEEGLPVVPVTMKGYQVCQYPDLIQTLNWGAEEIPICPNENLEEIFMFIICMSFGLSLLGWLLIWSRLVDSSMICWQFVEISYHVACSMLLFTTAVMYIDSANQIETFTKEKDFSDIYRKGLQTQEKIAAGAFALMQSLLYGLVAGLLGHRTSFLTVDVGVIV